MTDDKSDLSPGVMEAARKCWRQLCDKAGEDNVVLSKQRDAAQAAARDLWLLTSEHEHATGSEHGWKQWLCSREELLRKYAAYAPPEEQT